MLKFNEGDHVYATFSDDLYNWGCGVVKTCIKKYGGVYCVSKLNDNGEESPYFQEFFMERDLFSRDEINLEHGGVNGDLRVGKHALFVTKSPFKATARYGICIPEEVGRSFVVCESEGLMAPRRAMAIDEVYAIDSIGFAEAVQAQKKIGVDRRTGQHVLIRVDGLVSDENNDRPEFENHVLIINWKEGVPIFRIDGLEYSKEVVDNRIFVLNEPITMRNLRSWI